MEYDVSENFKLLYHYYINKGFTTIILSYIVHQFILFFLVVFSLFLYSCIDYNLLFKSHDIYKSLTFTLTFTPFIITSLIIISLLWIWYFYVFLMNIPKLKQIKNYFKILNIDNDSNNIEWNDIVNKINNKNINKHLMQKNNFLILFYNQWNDFNFKIHKSLISNLLNWVIEVSFDIILFSDKKHKNINKTSKNLQILFIFLGIIITLFSPFIVIFLLIYYFFKYTEEFKKSPKSLGIRDWNVYSKWKLRKIDELYHIFESRLVKTYIPTYELLENNYSINVSIIAKLISFISGSILAVLTILTLYDDRLLISLVDNENHSVLWYIGLFGIILTVSSSFIPSPHLDYNPSETIKTVIKYTEYDPKKNLDNTIKEYNHLFSYKIVQLFQEIISIISIVILCILLSKRSLKITTLFIDNMYYDNNLNGYYYSNQIQLNQHQVLLNQEDNKKKYREKEDENLLYKSIQMVSKYILTKEDIELNQEIDEMDGLL